MYFDLYGTINSLINHSGVTLADLCRWVEIIHGMPYYREVTAGDRTCIVVHAGYAEKLEEQLQKTPIFLLALEQSFRAQRVVLRTMTWYR